MISQDAIAAKATVGTVTAATGLASYFDLIHSGLSIVAVILGIILTGRMLYKEFFPRGDRRSTDGDKDG